MMSAGISPYGLPKCKGLIKVLFSVCWGLASAEDCTWSHLIVSKGPDVEVRRHSECSPQAYLQLDSPYGELKLHPPNIYIYFTDLKQVEASLHQILIKIIKIHKMHVQQIQGRHFLRKQSPCGTPHNIAKGLVPLSVAICRQPFRYLPLFAANPSTTCICR